MVTHTHNPNRRYGAPTKAGKTGQAAALASLLHDIALMLAALVAPVVVACHV